MRKHIYIIARVVNGVLIGPVKIGISRNPVARLRELQTGSPHSLVIVHSFPFAHEQAARDTERIVHDRMARLNVGGEWFSIAPIEAVALVGLFIAGHLEERHGIEAPESFSRPEVQSIGHLLTRMVG